jgi:hypothetical protein
MAPRPLESREVRERSTTDGTPAQRPCDWAMEEKPDIKGMHLTWRLIVEVLHVRVTAEQWTHREFEQDV